MENESKVSVSDELIARYLSGEATPEEAMALQEWLANPVHRNHFEGMKGAWYAALPVKKPRQVDRDVAWSSVRGKMEKTPVVSRTLNSRILYIGIAASVTIMFTTGLLLYFMETANELPEMIVTTTDSSRHLNLSDNSAVILNRNSSISYPESFSDQTREVNLVRGEAFFFVSPDSEKPFIVHTTFADIRVIGTTFNVVADEHRLLVGVNEGKVMLYNERDSVTLVYGFTGEVNSSSKAIAVRDSTNVNDWVYATNRLVFKDTPLTQVIAAIEKSYPYSIRTATGNIKNCKLTATFEKVSVEKMLYLIAETLNLSITRNGKVFILEGEGCP